MCSRFGLLPRVFFLVSIVIVFITCSIVCGIDSGHAGENTQACGATSVDDSLWTVDDVIMQERAQDFQFSPDGLWVLWVKRTPDKKKDEMLTHIFLTGLGKDSRTVALTRGKDSEFSPRWSPSGSRIAFLSTRKVNGGDGEAEESGKGKAGGSQVWLMDFPGGEPKAITRLEFGVKAFEWIDDNRILILAREKRTLLEEEQKKQKDNSLVVEDDEHMPPYRLFILEVESGKLKRITENNDQIGAFYLSRDKRWVVTRNIQSLKYEVDKREKPRFFLIDLSRLASQELFTEPDFKPQMIAWDYGSRGFYFSIRRTSDYLNEGPGADFLYYFDLKSMKFREIELNWDWGLFYLGFSVRPDGFITSLANGSRPRWRRYFKVRNGYRYRELKGEHVANIYALYIHPDKDMVIYEYSRASVPPIWYKGHLKRERVVSEGEVVRLNRHLDGKRLARAEVIKWKGAMNDEIEGILYYPHDFTRGKRYPLVLMIHGGPTGVDMDRFRESWAAYPNLMAQRGAFVLRVNYHGSGGYGQKFAESLKGHYYEYELEDIKTGIDKLAGEGLIDPDRVSALGWSNGGILTIALSVWTDLIKVAGVGAADANWISDYGNCAFGVSFDNYYFKGPFWEELDHYIEKSPIFHLKDMSVPTIIFHGTEDKNVPYEQGWEYYRALQQIGKTPVRFIVFPGEPHGLRKLSHQRRKMTEELGWFDRYFFGKETQGQEALKKDSPLDLAIKKLNFAHDGSCYGVRVMDRLIPETVTCVVNGRTVGVGRFEVTRAQWAEFDSSYSFDPQTANYPVAGVLLEKAKEYVEWLSSLTGKNYRLPDIEELKELASSAPSGNILNYWAGYTLNYDDANELRKLILDKRIDLTLPVDAFRPDRRCLFGLKGNVSEWALDEMGKGKVVGKSAIIPLDDATEYEKKQQYTGFRIFLELE